MVQNRLENTGVKSGAETVAARDGVLHEDLN